MIGCGYLADGVEVDDGLCKWQMESTRGREEDVRDLFPPADLVHPCLIACPLSCRTTPWSSWSSCHGNCDAMGSGRRSRSRVSYIAKKVSGWFVSDV